MTDLEQLVNSAQAGNKDDFAELVRRFQNMAYGYAYSVLGDFHLAEDAAQEAFIEAWRCLPKLRQADAFPGWFHRIVRYQCSRLTRAKRLPLVPIDEARELPSSEPSPAEVAEANEMRYKLTEAVRSLPPPQREATNLFYINGYSERQIASFLEVPVGTVKSRLHASRKALKARMMDMVKEVFDEHKLPDDFAGRVIKGVPVLGWNVSGNTTYMATVEALLAVTDRPMDYASLMVASGLAFRLRYVRQKDGRGWCTVGPVGQFEEEATAVGKASGCRTTYVDSGGIAEMKRRTVAAIDAGWCPFAYIKWDSGVIYGYDDDGDTVFVRCYDLGEGFHRMSLEEMVRSPGGQRGPFFMEPKDNPLPKRDALIQGLKMGLMNWRRGRQPGEQWQPWRPQGVWEYCFGDAAYEAWLEDLHNADTLSEDERKNFQRVHNWMAYHLYDARLAGARFLDANAGLFGAKAQAKLEKAAQNLKQIGESILNLQKQGVAFPPAKPEGAAETIVEWTTERIQREIAVLTEARRLDGEAMAILEAALS